MRKVPILGTRLTYQSAAGGAEISYFVPYEATAYSCARCHEQFFALEEDHLYRSLRKAIKGKVCPTCQTPLRECLVEQGIPLLNRDREEFDAKMRAEGYDCLSITDDVYAEMYDLFT